MAKWYIFQFQSRYLLKVKQDLDILFMLWHYFIFPSFVELTPEYTKIFFYPLTETGTEYISWLGGGGGGSNGKGSKD